ncbi:MAG TPA: hypothetical protein VKH41_04750 [Myxococcota bacterium]|nr:hypothetical protein [Myxococcota bacterium]
MARCQSLFHAIAALFVAAPVSAAISGVCPDGSIFIVQSADAIPCRDAKRVDPTDLPPLQPELLPRPYGWERFNRRADPNNPYNLVETPAPPGLTATAPPVAPAPKAATSSPFPQTAPPQIAALAPSAPARRIDLALSARDIADLDEIVALSQSLAPAAVSRFSADGERIASLQLARSSGFEQRVHAALAAQSGGQRGPVVLFRAEAHQAGPIHGNLTFVQGHAAFHPDPANPDQFGVIDGALGELAAGERVLGYAVLPAHLDPAAPAVNRRGCRDCSGRRAG